MKRASALLAAGLLAGVSTLALAGGASAADYPVKAPSMTLIGCPDIVTGVTVQITDLQPNSSVTTNWALVPPTGAAGSTGTTNSTAVPPGTATTKFTPGVAGNYSVTAVGTALGNKPWTGTLTVNVLPTCVPAVGGEEDTTAVADTETEAVTAGLADTGGGNAGTLLAIGAGALLVGGTVVLVARTRSRRKADAS
jgi:hypothetical protein